MTERIIKYHSTKSNASPGCTDWGSGFAFYPFLSTFCSGKTCCIFLYFSMQSLVTCVHTWQQAESRKACFEFANLSRMTHAQMMLPQTQLSTAGQLASVIAVDHSLSPPSYVVRMAQSGDEARLGAVQRLFEKVWRIFEERRILLLRMKTDSDVTTRYATLRQVRSSKLLVALLAL